MVATRFLKRRQRVPKPRDRAPKFTLKSSPWEARGQHRRNRQGGEGSSVRPGSQERGKGTGWIAWKPGRSHSRPRASKTGRSGRRLNNDPGPEGPSDLPGAQVANTKRGGSRGPRKRSK